MATSPETIPIKINMPTIHVEVLHATYRCGDSMIDMHRDGEQYILDARQFSLPADASPQKSWQSADAVARGHVERAERQRLIKIEANKL